MTLILTPRVLVPQWIERSPSVRVVTGSIPADDSDFALSHACDVLISSLFTSLFVVSLASFPSPVDGLVFFLGWVVSLAARDSLLRLSMTSGLQN